MIENFIKNFLPLFVRHSGMVTAIHLTDNTIRFLEMQRRGDKGVIRRCLSSKRGEERDLLQDLKNAFKQCPVKGKVVIITDEVRFLASELNIMDAEHLSEEKQLAAAMWEIEPYLDFSPSEGLFACEIQQQNIRGDRMPVLVAAIKRVRYTMYETILKDHNLELVNVYAPETAITASLDFQTNKDRKFVIGCYGQRIMGVSITDQEPFVFQEKKPVDKERIGPVLEEIIRELTDIAGRADEIVLAGRHISDEDFDSFEWASERIRTWNLNDLKNVVNETGNVGIDPEYAASVSVALHELGLLQLKLPALTDRVPMKNILVKKVNENPRLIPGITLGCLIFLLGAHYIYTVTYMNICEKRLGRLKTEEHMLTGPAEEERRLRSQLEQIKNKKFYIEETLPQCNSRILGTLNTVSELIPQDVVLDSIRQEQDGSFTIEGNSFSGQSITDFNDSLSSLDYCKTTVLENVSRSKKASGTRERIFPYSFSIKIRF